MRINKKNEPIIIVIILILINFLIKGFFLSSNSLGGDEPFSVYHAQMDVSSIIGLLSEGNNPPFYEIILHFWIKLFGISEFAVRFLSLIFSCITVLFMYKLGAKYLNKRIALYSSILFIFSNYHILFAHEARVYSLVGMLSLMSMYYFLELIQYKKENAKEKATATLNNSIKKKYILYILLNILLIYSHYFGFFILVVQFLFIIINKQLFLKLKKQVLMSIGLLVLFFLPNIFILIPLFLNSTNNGTWVSPPNGIESIYNMLWTFSNAPVVAVFAIAIFFGAFIKFIIKRKTESTQLSFRLMLFWFVFIFFFMFGISYIVPMFLDRYLMPVAVSYSIVLAISADYLIKKPKLKFIIPSIICILFIVTVKPNITNKRNVEETVEKIKDLKKSETLVLICPYNFILNYSYYHNIDIFKNYNTVSIYSSIDEALQLENMYGINSINEIEYKHWNHILFLDAAASFSYPNNNIQNELYTDYKIVNKYQFYEIFDVYEYELRK